MQKPKDKIFPLYFFCIFNKVANPGHPNDLLVSCWKNWYSYQSITVRLNFENSEFENSEFKKNSEFQNQEFQNSDFKNSEFENLEFENL